MDGSNSILNVLFFLALTLVTGETGRHLLSQTAVQDYLPDQAQLTTYGLTTIRILIGLTFVVHGLRKVVKGPENWNWMGSQMKNFGINSPTLFMIFGISAALAEFGGGLALTFGYQTQLFSALLAFTMLVAVVYHLTEGDGWNKVSFPLSLIAVFIGLILTGSGPYSFDAQRT